MEEKVSDKDILTALKQASEGFGSGYIGDLYKNTISLIHFLQNENANLKIELKRELAEHEEFTKKAKDEIERLIWTSNLQRDGTRLYERRCEELQKQVNELEDICLDCPYKLKFHEIEKQAVKDTANEIYTQVLEWLPVGEDYSVFIHNIEQWLKEKYGVEVE